MFINLLKNLFIVSLFFSSGLSSCLYADNIWKQNKNEDGIRVFTKDVQGSALKAFRGVVSIPARLSSIVAVIDDTSIYLKLFHNATYAKDLMRISENEAYKYMITALPWPAKNRDSIIRSNFKQNKKSKIVQITMKSVPNYIPSKPGLVRIQRMTGRWLLVPEGNNVKVFYEMNVDPSGSLPTWLVNAMSIDLPFITLKNLRELVKQEKYKKVKSSFILD